MDFGYFAFMDEVGGHGYVNGHHKAIENAIKEFRSLLAKGLDPNDYIEEVLEMNGLSEDKLTPQEIERINKSVHREY